MKTGIVLTLMGSLLSLTGCPSKDEPTGCIDESKIDPTAACIEIFDPVCGCDGETYSNSCYAEIAGVTSFTDGECDKD